ncbi:MAG: DUF1622 domain-containing protein [Gammaproteobacteria bacterium]|nr:DUF1622 domain-containing protein [Gammaproteobacteria bacterium]
MLEQILKYLENAGGAINLFAVAVIVFGFILAVGRYAIRFRDSPPVENFKRFKIGLGKALTLGLEILVLSDVIETITVKPTYQSLAVLAFLVVARTAMSWTLALEIEGRWPWQPGTEGKANA